MAAPGILTLIKNVLKCIGKESGSGNHLHGARSCLLCACGVDAIDPVASKGDEELQVPLAGLRNDEVQILECRCIDLAWSFLQLVVVADAVSKHSDHSQIGSLCTFIDCQ